MQQQRDEQLEKYRHTYNRYEGYKYAAAHYLKALSRASVDRHELERLTGVLRSKAGENTSFSSGVEQATVDAIVIFNKMTR